VPTVPKSSTQRSRKGRNDRGYRAEDQFVEEFARVIGDLELIPKHAEHQRLHPQDPHDIPISLSSKLLGNYSVKSVGNKSAGQASYQVCAGDACVVTGNIKDITNPLIMALVIRHEEELKNHKEGKKTVSLESYTIDLHKYKEALYGTLNEHEMHEIFERLKDLKKDYTSKDDKIAEEARAEIDAINVRLRAAGARLKLAPKASNREKNRPARLQAGLSIDKLSPRFRLIAKPFPMEHFKISSDEKMEVMSFGKAAKASRNSAASSAAPRASSAAPRASSAAPRASSAAPRASSAASRKSSASKRSSSAIRVSDLNKNVYLVPRTGIGKRRLPPIAE
jgi:chemotaxis protein histidine kinase CheA